MLMMTRFRILLCSIGLIFLILVSVGFYVYWNFPLIVESQAKQYMQGYGVENLHYEGLKVSQKQLRTDTLYFSGEHNNFSYKVEISSLSVSFNWRMLLTGEIQTIKLDSVELFLTEKAPAAQGSPSTQVSTPIQRSTLTSINLHDFRPRTVLESLPVESMAIKHWQISYKQASQPAINVTGSLQLSDQLQLQLQSSHQDSRLTASIVTSGNGAYPSAEFQFYEREVLFLDVNASLLSATPSSWDWNVEGEINYAPLLAWVRRVGQGFQFSLNISALEGLRLDGNSKISANVSHPSQLSFPDTATPFDYSFLEVQFHTVNKVRELNLLSPHIKMAGDLTLGIFLSEGEFNFILGATELQGILGSSYLELPDKTLNWLGWGETVPVYWHNPEDGRIASTKNGGWSFHFGNNSAALGDEKSELRWENLVLNGTVVSVGEVHQQIHVDLKTRLNTRLRKKPLPPINLSITFDGTSPESQFQLDFDDVAESFKGVLRGELNLSSGQGHYAASLRSQDLPYVSETFVPLLQELNLLEKGVGLSISSGSMTLDTQLEGTDFASLKQQSQLKITQLSGLYDEYQFEGIALDAQWSGVDHWQTQKPIKLSMKRFDIGFELHNRHLSVSLPQPTAIDQPAINIDKFSSEVFGGKVYLSEPHEWDFCAKSNRFKLQADQWNLADIVALQQGQDIQAQGVLEGALPVTVTEGRIIIGDGYLKALAPGGIIRYIANESSRSLAAKSPELGMALELLADFQYEVLRSQVALDKAGNLSLGLSLAGKNPAQFEGRRVNFNINLEQNLDPLLQSLRLSDKLIEKLEKSIH